MSLSFSLSLFSSLVFIFTTRLGAWNRDHNIKIDIENDEDIKNHSTPDFKGSLWEMRKSWAKLGQNWAKFWKSCKIVQKCGILCKIKQNLAKSG